MTDAVNAGPIAATAIVADWVTLGAGCSVGHYALLGRVPSQSPTLARKPEVQMWLSIGARTEIGPHAIVFCGTSIGEDCLIGDAASVREGCVIGNRCIIGRHVTINYDVVLGDDVKIQDFSHITGGCVIGAGTFVGVNVVTSNDRRPEIVDYKYVGVTPPIIGKRCLIGSGACIIPGVRIGDGAVIGAGALVTKDVPPGGRVLGQPARGQPLKLLTADPIDILAEARWEPNSQHLKPGSHVTNPPGPPEQWR